MKLVNFSATNYRSITVAHKISFSNVTVLIGKNNEGKSNLLRALEVAMNLMQHHSSSIKNKFRTLLTDRSPYQWKRDFPIQLQTRRNSTQTILKLEFLLDDNECKEFKKEIGANLNGSLPIEIKLAKTKRHKYV